MDRQKLREITAYLIFGVLTTLVSWVSYILFEHGLGMSVFAANLLSWVCAVAFAYLTNKVWVFGSRDWSAGFLVREILAFLSSRLATGVVEIVGVPLLVRTGIDTVIYALLERTPLCSVGFLFTEGIYSKVLISGIVIILNYVFSKLLVFRKKA